MMKGVNIVGIGGSQVGILGGKNFLGGLVLSRGVEMWREIWMVLEISGTVISGKPCRRDSMGQTFLKQITRMQDLVSQLLINLSISEKAAILMAFFPGVNV